MHVRHVLPALLVACASLGALGACTVRLPGEPQPQEAPEAQPTALEVLCVDSVASVPEGAPVCGDDVVLECEDSAGAALSRLFVVEGPEGCTGASYSVSEDQPFAVGEHDVSVVRYPSTEALCSTHVTVVDRTPPTVDARVIELWPPDHRMVRITPAECAGVADLCGAVELVFTGARVSEPDDAGGDGATEVDVQATACDAVEVRAERSGSSGGRVYELDVQARDAAGNVAAGICRVVVPHDQGENDVPQGAPMREVAVPPCAALL
jgi:hypothetical protein